MKEFQIKFLLQEPPKFNTSYSLMRRSLTVYSYSQSRSLSAFSARLLRPRYDVVRLKRWDAHYPFTMFRMASTDWYIHLDEDAFVFRPESIQRILDHMEKNGYVCGGMPDGGAVSIRFHNPVACNPFFLIVHRKALLQAYAEEPDVMSCAWSDEYERYTPSFVRESGLPYAYDQFEQYYPFFNWICKSRMPTLYLQAETWSKEPEGITTLLQDSDKRPFLLHTWYSREYSFKRYRYNWTANLPSAWRWAPKVEVGSTHKERIDRVIRQVGSLIE